MALGFVRPARVDDAAEIARIQLTTWQVAYRGMIPQRVLDGMDPEWMTQRWREAIAESPSPQHRVLVAIEQTGGPGGSPESDEQPEASPQTSDYLVGFAAIGPADEAAVAPNEPPLPADVAAVTDLLVEPRWGRRGHGSRLLAAATDLWRQDGMHNAVAWAYETDTATRKFLESAGWAPDGAGRALDVDDLLVPQLRMYTVLGEVATQ